MAIPIPIKMTYEIKNKLGVWVLHSRKIKLKNDKEYDMYFFVKKEHMPHKTSKPCDSLPSKFEVGYTKNGWPFLINKSKHANK